MALTKQLEMKSKEFQPLDEKQHPLVITYLRKSTNERRQTEYLPALCIFWPFRFDSLYPMMVSRSCSSDSAPISNPHQQQRPHRILAVSRPNISLHVLSAMVGNLHRQTGELKELFPARLAVKIESRIGRSLRVVVMKVCPKTG